MSHGIIFAQFSVHGSCIIQYTGACSCVSNPDSYLDRLAEGFRPSVQRSEFRLRLSLLVVIPLVMHVLSAEQWSLTEFNADANTTVNVRERMVLSPSALLGVSSSTSILLHQRYSTSCPGGVNALTFCSFCHLRFFFVKTCFAATEGETMKSIPLILESDVPSRALA